MPDIAFAIKALDEAGGLLGKLKIDLQAVDQSTASLNTSIAKTNEHLGTTTTQGQQAGGAISGPKDHMGALAGSAAGAGVVPRAKAFLGSGIADAEAPAKKVNPLPPESSGTPSDAP